MFITENTRTFLFVFLLIFSGSLSIQYGYSRKFGNDWSRLLHVHPNPEIGKIIIKDFSPTAISLGGDHDGMYSYIIARDPLCQKKICLGIEDRSSLGFRYRRLFYSLIAGGFGTFSPNNTLWGLILLSSLGTALSAAMLALFLEKFNYSQLYSLAVLANPGTIEALCILTADNFALGLGTAGLYFHFFKNRPLGLLLLALSALTKESYFLLSLGLGLFYFSKTDFKNAFQCLILPALPVSIWAIYLNIKLQLPHAISGWGDFTLPLGGILSYLRNTPLSFYSIFSPPPATIAVMLLGIVFLFKKKSVLFKCLSTPWLILGLVLSDWIWRPGGDVARALIPLWITNLTMLCCLVQNFIKKNA